MIEWRAHRLWVGIMVLAVVIGVGSAPVLGVAQKEAAQKLAMLRAENDKSTASLQQLQSDIATAEKMKNEIDTHEAEKILAPADRLRAAQILERRADEARLTHFTYTLSPEQKVEIATVGAGKQVLANSNVTLAADAPTDNDVFVFLDALTRTMPGRISFQHVNLHRSGDTNAPIGFANVHATIEGEWLSNGASQNLAEVEK